MHSITLNVPEDLYSRIQEKASRSQRSLEAEFISVLSTAVSGTEELPAELSEVVETLDSLDDAQLWESAKAHLPEKVSEELQLLHLKQQRQGLTEQERQRSETLCLEYDRAMLVRARAAALLKERGHDVSSLLVRQ